MSRHKVVSDLKLKSALVFKRLRSLSTPYLLLLLAGITAAILIFVIIIFNKGKEIEVGPSGKNSVETTTHGPESNPDDFYLHPETVEDLDDEYNNDDNVKGVSTKEEDIRGDYKPYYVGKKAEDIEITTKAKGGLQRHKVKKSELGVELHEKRYDSAAFTKVLEDEPIFQYLDENGNWSNYEIAKIKSPQITEESEGTTVVTQSFEISIPDTGPAPQENAKDSDTQNQEEDGTETSNGQDNNTEQTPTPPSNGESPTDNKLNQDISQNEQAETEDTSNPEELPEADSDENTGDSEADSETPTDVQEGQSEQNTQSTSKIKGEISMRVGFSGNQHISKITFKLDENENTNRMIWRIHPDDQKLKHEITTKKNYDELKESAKVQSDDILIDWSDFGTENIEVKTGDQNDPYLQVVFFPDGQQGEITIDPTVSITVASTYIQIDVSNKYRARVDTTSSTTNLVDLYDRAENDTSPDNTVSFVYGVRAKEENITYYLSADSSRKTTILETTPTRSVIKVEGYLADSTESSYLTDGSSTRATASIIYTFTPMYIGIDTEVDVISSLTIDSTTYTDRLDTIGVRFNEAVSTAYSETVYYGNGETESSVSSDSILLNDGQGYVVFQGLGSYQDAIIAEVDNNGDKWLSSSTDGWDFYNVDASGESDLYTNREAYTQTLYDNGSAQYIFAMEPQAAFDTEGEREAYYNDFSNHDTIDITTGEYWPEGPATSGVEFDQTSTSNIDMNNAEDLDFGDTDDFTIEAWVYKGSRTALGDRTIVAKANGQTSSDTGYILWLDASDNKIHFTVTDSSSNQYTINGDTALLDDKWYHVAAVFDQNDTETTSLYLNGIQDVGTTDGTLSSVGALSNSNDFRIGSESDNGAGFMGRIDEVRVWNVARSYSQIPQNMKREISPAPESLIGYWQLNDAQGSTASDFVQSNDGTLGANAIWTEGFVPDLFNERELAYTTEISTSSDVVQFDIDANTSASTLTNGAVTAGSTSITVDSTSGFSSSGVAFINGDKFSYTGTTSTTFTGVPSSGTDAIQVHSDNSVVAISPRHNPTYKFTKWRSNTEPTTMKQDDSILTDGTNYNMDFIPITDGYLLREISLYNSLESTTSDIGSNLTNSGGSFVEAKYGNGFECNSSAEDAYFSTSGNLDLDKGTIEFWMQSNSSHTDSTNRYYFMAGSGLGSSVYVMKDTLDQFKFVLSEGGLGNSFTETVTSSNYYWAPGDWVHIRVEWDDSATSADQQKIFINGVEPTHTDSTGDYDSSNMGSISTAYIGNQSSSSSFHCNCTIDEFYMYDQYDGKDTKDLTKLAEGGETSDADEYLFDASNDATIYLDSVDASSRGEYLYLGSEEPIYGFNVDLATNGATSGTLNLTWQFWDGTEWSALEGVSGFSDGTNNLTQDGQITWDESPRSWRPYGFHGSTDLYYIRTYLANSSASYTTQPVEDTIKTDSIVAQHLATVSSLDTTMSFYSNNLPSAPQTPYCNNTSAQSGQASPVTGLIDHTPAFSAVFDDSDTSDTAEYYEIEVGTDTDWSTAEMWDSGKTSQTSCNENSRCDDIIYAGSSLTDGNTYYWRIRFWDQKDDVGSWSSNQTFSMNTPPTVSNISVNSGSNIELTENTTTSVSWSGTATDADGYSELSSATGKLYRSGVTGAADCTTNNNNCYEDSNCSFSECTGTSCTVSCTVDMQFHADPTDTGSTYASEYWRGQIFLTDTYSETGSGYSPTDLPDVATLRALAATSSIPYGSLTAGENTGGTNQTTTITNTGNATIDGEVSGTNMCTDYPTCSGNTLLVSLQEYGLTGFTYGSGTSLSTEPSEVNLNLAKPTQNPSDSTGSLYWGISIPSGSGTGSYTGENTITAIEDL